MVLHTTTRIENEDGPLMGVSEGIKEALGMIESSSPMVVVEGLAKLGHSTFNHPVCKETVGSIGAIKIISDAMARNINNISLQEDGCHALRNVVFHCESNLQLVCEQGGIAAVLNAMKAHPQNEAVQSQGCWALVVFCSNHEDNIAFVKPFLPVIEAAMCAHPDNLDICTKVKFLHALLA